MRLIPRTLKLRLIYLLLLYGLIPLVLIGSISYSAMYAMLVNKAEKGVTGNLHQVRLSFENTISQLNHASQQLVFEGRVGKSLEAYLAADLYDKRRIGEEIESEMSLIHFTNPTLGLIFYYLADSGELLFQNSHVRGDADIFGLPVLSEQLQLTYYGPHLSLNPLDGHKVLSVIRKVELPDRDDVYLYMETDFKLTDRIMSTDEIFADTFYFFVDKSGRIAYSDKQEAFPIGARMTESLANEGPGADYLLFEEMSTQSWRIVAAVPKRVYHQELHRWIFQFAVLTALSLAAGCVLAVAIWRMVYSPLLHLRRNIRRLKDDHTSAPPGFRYDRIQEFADIHRDFSAMKRRIDELILDIDRNARTRRKLEIENLMYKINPHFIHNTLDTIRWQARASGQQETDRLVSTLNRLLHYNLGQGRTARIADEIEALKHYVMLQGVRYNFHFDIRIQADPGVLEHPIPRFILQPLVENSIHHGLQSKSGDGGVIEVAVKEEGGAHVVLEVRDNGYGMTEEELQRMIAGGSETASKTGMGIGWQYVRRMLDWQYGGTAGMQVVSGIGAGTTITLRLPIDRRGGDDDAESDGRR